MPKAATQPVNTPVETIEQEARRLRDQIYGEQKDPNNWAHCKDEWVKDIDWLRKTAAAMKK